MKESIFYTFILLTLLFFSAYIGDFTIYMVSKIMNKQIQFPFVVDILFGVFILVSGLIPFFMVLFIYIIV